MYLIYNLIFTLLFFIIIPYFIIRSIKEKGFTKRFRQSMGFINDDEIAKVAKQNCIWIHGASVGEIVATSPLVKEIKRTMPNAKVLVSAVTTGGYDMAHQIIPEADAIIYFPIDMPFISSSVVKKIMPRVFMPVETELWPNFLRAIKLRKIPVMMVNGRISDKSVKSYRYLFGILKDMMSSVTRFCMQSELDASYIQHLGANPRKIFVTGNTKFDQTYAEVTPKDLENYEIELGIKNDDYPIIVGGSTHPTEEEALFKALEKIKVKYPKAKLVIAPRKTARIAEIVKLAKQHGFESGLRSELLEQKGEREDFPVLIIDTIGELGRIYAVGDLVYVGGSLIKHGGHNVLEPAAHAKPIIVGPHMYNFKDAFAMLSKVGACTQVENSDELATKMLEIIDNKELRKKMGEASMQVIEGNRGADVRSIDYLRELLDLTEIESRLNEHSQISVRNVEDEKPKMRSGDVITQYLYKIAHGNNDNLFDWLILAMLSFGSGLYGIGVKLKLGAFNQGLIKKTELDCCVISIGNITVGGTGKTPTAQKLATMIRNEGYKVVILNRGYRSHTDEKIGVVSDGKKIYMTAYEAGDEAYLMAKTLPGVPIIIGKDRSITGKFAVEKLGAEVILLDDGYQHWLLKRDLDVVLVDTLNMFGNNHLLPRGTLREPLKNLSRADLFLLTKADQSSVMSRMSLEETIRTYNKKAPIIESRHRPCNFIEIENWYKSQVSCNKSLAELAGEEVMVFSAIGNPFSFEQTLADNGLKIIESIRYPDHHEYGMQEMQYIMDRASMQNAKALIITAKDAVKIPTEFIYTNREVPLYILNMEIDFTSSGDEFKKVVRDTISNKVKLVKEKKLKQLQSKI